MKENICMDYDSMGDCGRFPLNKKRKQPVTLKDILIKKPHPGGFFVLPYIYK